MIQLRLVGDPVGVRVEAAAGDAEEAAAVDLADVDLARLAGREQADRRLDLVGDPEHPGEVVAAPAAGSAPMRRPGAGERAADLADQPVAADHDRDLAGRGRRRGPPRSRARGPVGQHGAMLRGRRRVIAASIRGSSSRARPPPADGLTSSRKRRRLAHRPMSLAERSRCGRRSRCRRPTSPLSTALDPAAAKAAREDGLRACRRGSRSRMLATTTTWPPGRSTRAISPKKGGTLTCVTRSKESSSYGSSEASATLKATRPSGIEADLVLRDPDHLARRGRRRGRSRAGTRGRGRAPPRRCRCRGRGRARAPARPSRVAAASAARWSGEPGAGARVPAVGQRGRRSPASGARTSGHSHGACATDAVQRPADQPRAGRDLAAAAPPSRHDRKRAAARPGAPVRALASRADAEPAAHA